MFFRYDQSNQLDSELEEDNMSKAVRKELKEILKDEGVDEENLPKAEKDLTRLCSWLISGHKKDPADVRTVKDRAAYYNGQCRKWLGRQVEYFWPDSAGKGGEWCKGKVVRVVANTFERVGGSLNLRIAKAETRGFWNVATESNSVRLATE